MKPMLKKIQELDLDQKTVFLRTDYNVPLSSNKVEKFSTWRLDATLETIEYLLSQKCSIIIGCHLGRPEGKIVEAFRLKPVAKYLTKALKRKLFIIDNNKSRYAKLLGPIGQRIYFMPAKNKKIDINQLKEGDIILLENLRFHPKEKNPSLNLAQNFAQLAQAYVNEAFATAHRKDTSIALIPEILPSAAGFLFQKEISTLSKIKTHPKPPLIFVMGGAKAKTKTELIKSFLPKSDGILVGGVLANTILAAQGIAVGKSIIDRDTIKALNDLEITSTKLHLPVDVATCPNKTGKGKIEIRPVGKVDKDNMILDIGPDTIILFRAILEKAATIVWNGPMGYTEIKKFQQGTKAVLDAMIKNKKAKIIAGGGESISLIAKNKLFKRVDFVSTGGGAMLEFLANKKLPGIEALKK